MDHVQAHYTANLYELLGPGLNWPRICQDALDFDEWLEFHGRFSDIDSEYLSGLALPVDDIDMLEEAHDKFSRLLEALRRLRLPWMRGDYDRWAQREWERRYRERQPMIHLDEAVDEAERRLEDDIGSIEIIFHVHAERAALYAEDSDEAGPLIQEQPWYLDEADDNFEIDELNFN